ncbi:hypothetical protein [Tahibacter amnicola]|uniref:Uncharacterized protein n=1 Tax=Tahibacter amnicola TaxID=2976241 RepID=A0ABY6BD05_9GAMM|nr:hypothetical protein [Tahibacter amnicola]UXI67924.1 hypothetical protein N4264_24880 [Tahibacter amnicola]
MTFSERRKVVRQRPNDMERGLNATQLATLRGLEHFGWELKFVRRPLFQPPVAVVFDPDRSHYAVLDQDGSLDEHPTLKLRH